MLVHRIPFPPDKGDKVRSFHLLKKLSLEFDVYLGAFVDNPRDWQYVSDLQPYCKEVKLYPLKPLKSKLYSLLGFFRGQPLSIPYYWSNALNKWVAKTVSRVSVKYGIIYSSQMAQYLQSVGESIDIRIADFVDIDSDKWTQYATMKSFPMSWIFRREGYLLQRYETKISRDFSKTYFVSETEKNDFARISPESSSKIDYYNNGVDYEYFDPSITYENPYDPVFKNIVFTGAMDYWANVDAVVWFSESIFPLIKSHIKNIRFYIVGGNPVEQVLKLSGIDGVVVTGRVDDIRPYMRFSDLMVAPMRIARGIQNKVLEAMSMARPLVVTSLAYDGIVSCTNYQPDIADSAKDFAELCISSLRNTEQGNLLDSRECIKNNYNWDLNIEKVITFLHKGMIEHV